MTITASELAHRDQLEAATRDTEHLAEAVTRRLTNGSTSRYPRGVTIAVAQAYAHQVIHHGLAGCGHLDPTAPSAAWWVHDSPGVLRCGRCTSDHLRRPGPLDRGCDLCGATRELRGVAVAAPAVIGRDITGQAVSLTAAILLAGACQTCWTQR